MPPGECLAALAQQRRISIQTPAKLPVCVSCHRPIMPWEKAVVFPCPKCGHPIWRCAKCRKMGVPYKCPNCGFEGP